MPKTETQPEILITRLAHSAELPLPAYESKEAAGMDLRAALPDDAPLTIKSGARETIPTGFAIALPQGYEAQIRPRSGLAAKHGLSVLNSPGTIDSDYRGEIKILLINHGQDPFVIKRGERIAQMVIVPVVQAALQEVAELPTSARGARGFGSTGKK